MANSNRCPEHLQEALLAYSREGRPMGDFLTAVLENDLAGAVGRADDKNILLLPDIVAFVYNKIPAPCWGSPEKVNAWLAKKYQERIAGE